MKLTIKPRYGRNARREWGIYLVAEGSPDTVVGYSSTYTAAAKAVEYLERNQRLLEFKKRALITQELIDERPRHQQPMGAVRQLLWNAARR